MKIKKNTHGVSLDARKLLTGQKIGELVAFTKKCVYLNNKGDINRLKTDLGTAICHVFGDHSKCANHLCNSPQQNTTNQMLQVKHCGLHHHLYAAVNLVISKAALLIEYETNNKAELFMSLLARFNMGKRLNLIQRDSFQTRSYITGLRYNKGSTWHASPWKTRFCTSPGKHLKRYMSINTIVASKRKNSAKPPESRKRLKFSEQKAQTCQQIDYGPNMAEIEMSETDLALHVDNLVQMLQVL